MAAAQKRVEVAVVPTIDRDALRRDVREALADVLEEIAEQIRTEVVE